MTDANDLDLDRLEPYQPRTFVEPAADLTDRATAEALYRRLLERPIASADDLQRWLEDRSELESALSQAQSVLYIRMTCQTDDPQRAQRYKDFVENVQPAIEPLADAMDRKYLIAREQVGPDDRYEVYDRDTRADVELFRQENVPLNTQVAMLSQQYQAVTGAMTVEFEGKERTLPEMGKFLLETDRPLRERAWRETAQRRLTDRDKIEDLFDQMLDLRNRIAANAGCKDFVEYQWRRFHRFDYTREDALRFHQAVERLVVPLWRDILDARRRRMHLDALRPWDTAVDPQGRPPLKPFERADDLIRGARQVFDRTDPELGRQFASLDELGLLELASRKGKAPGGYQSTLSEARKPFIFMNAVGLDRDVRTLLHEAGHAFHSLAAADQPLLAYRHAPIEFAEVASMGMELLADGQLGVFYGPDDEHRSRREHLEGIIYILPWVATVDAFQHWLYTHPGHSRDQRRAAWLETFARFDGGVTDWTGLEGEWAYLWHRQLHIFQYPFYYIEYAIAQLGALQLWVRARENPSAALADYRQALTLGGSRPLGELFEAAGTKLDFSERTITPLVQAVREELDRT